MNPRWRPDSARTASAASNAPRTTRLPGDGFAFYGGHFEPAPELAVGSGFALKNRHENLGSLPYFFVFGHRNLSSTHRRSHAS